MGYLSSCASTTITHLWKHFFGRLLRCDNAAVVFSLRTRSPGNTRRQLPQVKIPYIYRSSKKGNCLGSVGRWGLLKQQRGAFSARKSLKTPVYGDFSRKSVEFLVKMASIASRGYTVWTLDVEKRPRLPVARGRLPPISCEKRKSLQTVCLYPKNCLSLHLYINN